MVAARRGMLKLAAGLLTAAAVALLLDWYAPSGAAPPVGQRLRAPQPAPGAEAANLLWAVQVSGARVGLGDEQQAGASGGGWRRAGERPSPASRGSVAAEVAVRGHRASGCCALRGGGGASAPASGSCAPWLSPLAVPEARVNLKLQVFGQLTRLPQK